MKRHVTFIPDPGTANNFPISIVPESEQQVELRGDYN